MSALARLQSDFQQALQYDQALPAGCLRDRGVKQFEVYRHAYRARLRAALRDNYEVLPKVMGDDAFDALANAYLSAHPSQHYSLRWYGDQLVAFMATRPALVDHPALVDLARMEWALRQAFDAPDTPCLQATELADLPPAQWDTLVLALQPSVQLLSMQWAVGPIWHAIQSGADQLPAPPAQEHPLMVWRQGLRTQWKSLSGTEAAMLNGLTRGLTFGALCETLADDVGQEQAAATAIGHLHWLLGAQALASPATFP